MVINVVLLWHEYDILVAIPQRFSINLVSLSRWILIIFESAERIAIEGLLSIFKLSLTISLFPTRKKSISISAA